MYSDRKSIQSPHFVDLELYSKTFLLSLFFIYLKNIYFDLIALKGIGRRLCQSLSHVQLFRDPMSGSLLGSSVHGVSQARILEWVATSYSRGSSQPRDRAQVS